ALAASELKSILSEDVTRLQRYDARISARKSDVRFRPIVDFSTLSIEWNQKRCQCPGISLKLFERLCHYPGQYMTHEQLLRNVWQCHRSPQAIRSAVRQLRRKLRAAGMAQLADAIRSHGGSYALTFGSV